MRIKRLDLLRYGHFTKKSIELPAAVPDLHIIYGANEAGKSTTLAAVEDFLFGIPTRSPHNFLHDYRDMRVGAVLENAGETLEALRRKGIKDTLITPEPENAPFPAGERVLSTFLGGADLAFFTRMFSLDYRRLRRGGQDIIEARDEVGQMLFAASAGIVDFSERLRTLGEEGDKLWGPRRAGHRRYYQLEDRLKQADRSLREHTITVARWQELKRDYESARQAYEEIAEQINSLSAEQRKASRIRRVYRDVKRARETDRALAGLADVPALPDDAEQRLTDAERACGETAARIEGVSEQLEALRAERDALRYDEVLILRAPDIAQLEEQRIQVRGEKNKLPELKTGLAVKQAELRRLAQTPGWDDADLNELVARIPARGNIAAAQQVAKRQGELLLAVRTATKAIREAEQEQSARVRELDALGPRIELAALEGVLATLRRRGDIVGDIARTQRAVADAGADIDRRLRMMNPAVTDPGILVAVPVPPVATIRSCQERYRDAGKQKEDCETRLAGTVSKIEELQRSSAGLVEEKRAVTADALSDLRARRDRLWSLVRRHYIEGDPLSALEMTDCSGAGRALPEYYEASVSEADGAADRRFDTASESARLSVLAGQIADEEARRDALLAERDRLESIQNALDTEWTALWEAMPFAAQSPDIMLDWHASREQILGALEHKARAEGELGSLRDEEQALHTGLLDALRTLGIDDTALRDQSLPTAAESAGTILRDLHDSNETRAHLDRTIRTLSDTLTRKRDELAQAESDLAAWHAQWEPLVVLLGLPQGAGPEGLDDLVNIMEEMRSVSADIHRLRHDRIESIEAQVAAFERNATELVAAVAPELAELDSAQATVQLNLRLDEARRIKAALAAKDSDIKKQLARRTELNEAGREAREVIESLKTAARVDQIDQLRRVIEQSDRRRRLTQEREQLGTRLQAEGDGFALDELAAECDAADFDRLAGQEDVLDQKLAELRERLVDAGQAREAARTAFDAVGGDDAAARAEAERQATLAEMTQVAEHYTRVRVAERLLQWAIERYRQGKQAPLLTVAGQYFSTLTEGAYSGLRLDYDDNDKPWLVGLRADTSHVGVGAMSTGTADQLYLALRLAAIEDYLDRANPLPLVADDLFINFDDARAAAGFRVLGQLAGKTQILFFTHHAHLVELARETVSADIAVVSL
ncbi:MAG: AAA family ATPase [Thiogranum sp.]